MGCTAAHFSPPRASIGSYERDKSLVKAVIRFSRESLVESTHWMVLHRPSEPAAVTGKVPYSAATMIESKESDKSLAKEYWGGQSGAIAVNFLSFDDLKGINFPL
jgi:hypothetical protein